MWHSSVGVVGIVFCWFRRLAVLASLRSCLLTLVTSIAVRWLVVDVVVLLLDRHESIFIPHSSYRPAQYVDTYCTVR